MKSWISPTKARATVATAIVAAAGLLLAGCAGNASAGGGSSAAGSHTISVAYSGAVPVDLPLWYAADKGLLKKYGLNVTLKNLTGTLEIPALVSGQIQMSVVGAGEIVNAAAGGASLKSVATFGPVFPVVFFSAPNIKNAQQLIGKKVGVTALTGTAANGANAALKQLGLTASQVHLTTVGTIPNLQAALTSGAVSAGVVPIGSTADHFAALGFNKLYDLSKHPEIPYATTALAMTDSYLSANGPIVSDMLKAIVEAIKDMKTDKANAARILGKYIGSADQAANLSTVNVYTQTVFQAQPYSTLPQFQTAVDISKAANPGIAKVDLSKIVDRGPLAQVLGAS
jgi:ABC-type nitrate/sulfonate/bicarbonate transport system substrate-binding protein